VSVYSSEFRSEGGKVIVDRPGLGRRMAGMLKRLEWSCEDRRHCPECDGTRPVHDQECKLEALLNAIREREQEEPT